jgi:hypothetical protein
MKCPHCTIEINPTFEETYLAADSEGHWSFFTMICPNSSCKKLIIELCLGLSTRQRSGSVKPVGIRDIILRTIVRPLRASRAPVPIEVDKSYANDYNEACLTLSVSPKASAALSRRCLQNILRDKAGVKKADLSNEIQEVIDNGKLPSHLSDSIDAVRNIGNFAAHPIKSKSTGEVVPIEIGEADWLLDVIEGLFDFYFVQPAIIANKRAELNKKLADAGKPPMK